MPKGIGAVSILQSMFGWKATRSYSISFSANQMRLCSEIFLDWNWNSRYRFGRKITELTVVRIGHVILKSTKEHSTEKSCLVPARERAQNKTFSSDSTIRVEV